MSKPPKLIYLAAFAVLVACDSRDTTRDFGLDAHPLSELSAGIWIDPNGCDHWIIDDGIEGYMSPRLDLYGRPICSGAGPAGHAVGDFKGGSPINDILL